MLLHYHQFMNPNESDLNDVLMPASLSDDKIIKHMARKTLKLFVKNETPPKVTHEDLVKNRPRSYSAAIFLIPICISFDTAEKRRYATYLILNRRFSFEF